MVEEASLDRRGQELTPPDKLIESFSNSPLLRRTHPPASSSVERSSLILTGELRKAKSAHDVGRLERDTERLDSPNRESPRESSEHSPQEGALSPNNRRKKPRTRPRSRSSRSDGNSAKAVTPLDLNFSSSESPPASPLGLERLPLQETEQPTVAFTRVQSKPTLDSPRDRLAKLMVSFPDRVSMLSRRNKEKDKEKDKEKKPMTDTPPTKKKGHKRSSSESEPSIKKTISGSLKRIRAGHASRDNTVALPRYVYTSS